jgi:hypothetical protein
MSQKRFESFGLFAVVESRDAFRPILSGRPMKVCVRVLVHARSRDGNRNCNEASNPVDMVMEKRDFSDIETGSRTFKT